MAEQIRDMLQLLSSLRLLPDDLESGASGRNCVLSVGLRKEGEPTYFCEESPRIRRTEVRPSRSRRAISALATPARCSLRISAA